MKIKKNDKYLNIAVYAFIVIVLSILFYLLASKVDGVFVYLKTFISIFSPIIIGFTMAYLFDFILVFFEKKVFNKLKIKEKFKRLLSIVATYITVLVALVFFFQFILPQLLSSLVNLLNDVPSHVRDISNMLIGFSERFQFTAELNKIIIEGFNEFTAYLVSLASSLLPRIGNITRSIFSSISNLLLGLIISIYVLVDKEKFKAQSKKFIYATLSKDGSSESLRMLNRANKIFGSFLSGKILDSFIIAILTFVTLMLFKMPYAMLIAFIIGVFNIIPFFGPFIGAIPSFFIILVISPQKAFIFLILIFIIQQIDGNIIGPKILGDSLGISPFWILFSLLISGKLLGFVGLIIGVPLFVFIYSIIKEVLEARLKKKGLAVETASYYDENKASKLD